MYRLLYFLQVMIKYLFKIRYIRNDTIKFKINLEKRRKDTHIFLFAFRLITMLYTLCFSISNERFLEVITNP